MQIFRYMVYIWDAYEKEAEQKQPGISKRAGFKYPVVLPIVYYEGVENWTVPADFKSRIQQGEAFGKYIPDFEYYLVPLKDYSNEELLEQSDEISLVMLINKLQTPEDVEKFRRIPPQKLEDSIRLFVESFQEFGIAKEEVVTKLAEKYQFEPEEAGKMVEIYYKSE